MTGLKVWYGVLSHKAGLERRVVVHATSAVLAEKMAWAGHAGSKVPWDLIVIEAIDYAATREDAR